MDSIITQIMQLENNDKTKGILSCKWAFDGASDQSEYKQKFDNDSSKDSNISVWTNPKPSSIRFCRPV